MPIVMFILLVIYSIINLNNFAAVHNLMNHETLNSKEKSLIFHSSCIKITAKMLDNLISINKINGN